MRLLFESLRLDKFQPIALCLGTNLILTLLFPLFLLINSANASKLPQRATPRHIPFLLLRPAFSWSDLAYICYLPNHMIDIRRQFADINSRSIGLVIFFHFVTQVEVLQHISVELQLQQRRIHIQLQLRTIFNFFIAVEQISTLFRVFYSEIKKTTVEMNLSVKIFFNSLQNNSSNIFHNVLKIEIPLHSLDALSQQIDLTHRRTFLMHMFCIVA
jgi:hypothetical protein